MGVYVKKYRVNTTISLKHHEILKKYVEEFGTQQSVLEHALESLDDSNNQRPELSPEGELWMRIFLEIKSGLTLLHTDLTKKLFEIGDIEEFREFVNNEKPGDFAVEWYYNKSLNECSVQEIVDIIIIHTKIQGGADTVTCTEDENNYNINITHRMGINWGNVLLMGYENMLKGYGAKFDCKFSERSVFIKIYK